MEVKPVTENVNTTSNIINFKNIYGIDTHGIGYDDCKVYSNMFGTNFEQELVNGILKYNTFKVNIKNCKPDTTSPEYILYKEVGTGNVKAIVYAPIAITIGSKENVLGKVNLIKQNNNIGEYVVKSDFSNVINNEDTKGAVVSQSFNQYISKQVDSSVYKIQPNINSYLSQYMFFSGKLNQTYIRTEEHNNLYLNEKDIISAKYYVHKINKNNNSKMFISVASINNRGELYNLSGYGKAVDVAAPGEDIYSCMPDGDYRFSSGTSAATAFVTGVAALMKSYNTSLSANEIANIIKNNCNKMPKLLNRIDSGGIIDAYECLKKWMVI